MQTGHNADSAGYVDAHVHLSTQEGVDSVLSAGIFALRNAGAMWDAARKDCFYPEKPVMISSCRALYKRGGYGARFGVPVDTKAEIKAEIIRLKRSGAGIIKVMASGLVSLTKPGSVTPGGFDRDELGFIVEEAAALGLGVMAHANGEAAVMAAAEAGVLSIEHGFFMTERALDVMARKRVFWTPTVDALARAAEVVGASVEIREFVAGLILSHLKMLGRASTTGVPLAVGTDCVLPDPHYGEAYNRELGYFERAGLSHEEVLRVAREDGARLLGLA